MAVKKIVFDTELLETKPQYSFNSPKVFTNDKISVDIVFNILDMKDSELIGTSAQVLLYMGDGSFFQNTDAVLQGTKFVYRMKANETKHAGNAQAQLVVTDSAKEIASPLFEFRIDNGLGEKVAQEVVIKDWNTITSEARAFIADMKVNEESRKSAFTTSQNQRKTAFDNAQTKRETDFTSAQTLRKRDYDSFKTTIESSETQRAENETGRVSAENIRKETFTANELERKETFEGKESDRQVEFEASEAGRTTAFNQTEASRNETFNANENVRQEGENERKQAELQREESYDSKVDAAIVEADVVTKVDDKVAELSPTIQNVTAQLAQTESNVNRRVDELVIESGDGNAEVADAHVSTTKNKTFPTIRTRMEELESENTLVMSNRAINGDFNTNTVGWTTGGSSHALNNGQLQVTGNGAADYSLAHQPTGITLVTGHKWFMKFKVTPTNVLPVRFRVVARGDAQTIIQNVTANIAMSTPLEVTAIYTAPDTTELRYGIQAVYADTTTATGAVYLVDKVVLVNLTETFGAGLEPSESEMTAILRKYGDSYFEGKANAVDAKKVYQDLKSLATETESVRQIDSVISSQLRRNQITTRTPYDLTVSGSYTSKKRPIWTISYDDEAKCVHQYGFPVHQSENVPGTFCAVPNRIESGNVYNYGVAMTWADLLEMKNAGWEIGHHTVDHLNTSYMDRDTLVNNIETGNKIFSEHGIFPSHFAHPGGSNSQNNSNVLKEYFDSSGLTTGQINGYDLNPWRLSRTSADSWYDAIYKRITKIAEAGEGWLISYHHAIHPDGNIDGVSGNMNCWTPTQLRTAIQYAKSLGVEVVTMDEGLRTYAPYMYYFDEVNDPSYAVQRNGIVKTATPIV